jgi:hypothetical protein
LLSSLLHPLWERGDPKDRKKDSMVERKVGRKKERKKEW